MYRPGNSLTMAYYNQMWADAKAVTPENIANYAARYGQSFGGGLEGITGGLNSLMPNQIHNPWAGKKPQAVVMPELGSLIVLPLKVWWKEKGMS